MPAWPRPNSSRRLSLLLAAACAIATLATQARPAYADPLLPEHVTADAQRSVQRGLKYLANIQGRDGSWTSTRDGQQYPVSMTALAGMAFLANGNTPSRGPYADQVARTVRYLIRQQDETGLISGPNGDSGRPMYGHGFALLFLASAYGMETDADVRQSMHAVIKRAILLTARGQSPLGGWTYTPGSGDEGSVTITQMQALRAAHNAGFKVPESTIASAISYLEACQTPDGGIRYSFGSDNSTRLPISAAAIACLYSAGEYDSPLAETCLGYVFGRFQANGGFSKGGGHDYYSHLYASQAFYQAGDDYWNKYFPDAQKQLVSQQQSDGSWNGDGVGTVYGTSISLIVLQLPYKFLPIYQR